MSDWIPVSERLPEENIPIEVISYDRQRWNGTYVGDGQFWIMTNSELQDTGSFRQSYTHIYKSYFKHYRYAATLPDPPEVRCE
jgi:hypothetical protein